MKKRAFTLIEIIIVVIIVGIFGTLGFPAYQNAVEASKDKACDANLEVLKTAVEIYTMEHNTVPGSLSALKPEHIEKAFAKVMQGKDGWKKRLAYFIAEGPQWGWVYAQSYGMPHLRCPKNTGPSATAISYGLNLAIAGITSSAYKALPDNTVIVGDSNSYLGIPGVNPGALGVYDYHQFVLLRGHKRYLIMQNPDGYLKGITKGSTSGRVDYSGRFSLNP